jgi:hypothetical protein
MVESLRDVVEDACQRVMLLADDSVLDIGCNDGTMLKMFPRDVYRLGFEPSDLCPESRPYGDVPIYGPIFRRDYFPPKAEWLRSHYPKCKVITSIAMFYDLDDPNTFVAAIKDWLHPDGVWVCQMMDLHQMLSANAFDNVCHEHLAYYSYYSFNLLVQRHGLYVADMSANDVNGGSIRFIVKHMPKDYARKGLIDFRPDEADIKAFAKRVQWLKIDTLRMLDNLMLAKQSVWGYGASTKGNTLLQYYGIGPHYVQAIADRNPDKWGKKTVGSGIPIVSEAEWREANAPYTLVLPWHFIDTFKVREQEYLARGGTFILPLPRLQEVTYAGSISPRSASVVGAGSPA